jgi:hypothetical protein
MPPGVSENGELTRQVEGRWYRLSQPELPAGAVLSAQSGNFAEPMLLPDRGGEPETRRPSMPQGMPAHASRGVYSGDDPDIRYSDSNAIPIEPRRRYEGAAARQPALARMGDRIRSLLPPIAWPRQAAQGPLSVPTYSVRGRMPEIPIATARTIPLPLWDSKGVAAKEKQNKGWLGHNDWSQPVWLDSPEPSRLVGTASEPDAEPPRQSSPSTFDPESMRVPFSRGRIAAGIQRMLD